MSCKIPVIKPIGEDEMQSKISAMPYYGGKSRPDMRDWLLPKIPYIKQGLYVEPFAGMLGVLLARPKTKLEIVNDLDSNIANWWEVVREQPEELAWYIHNTTNCRQTFMKCFKGLKAGEFRDDKLKWAWATYVSINYNVAHGTGVGGWAAHYTGGTGSKGKKLFAKYVQPMSDRLRHVMIECRDALVILERVIDVENAVVYCDPPYFTADTTAYSMDAESLDLDKMKELFLAQKGKVAISGYGEEWDCLGWERHEWKTRAYPLSDLEYHKKQDWSRVEVLWCNYKVGDSQLHLF